MKGVYKFLNDLFDLVYLNIIFVLSCLPIITIPISWTALVLMEMESKGNYGYILPDFMKYWKRVMVKVLKATIWSALILAMILLVGIIFKTSIFNIIQFIVGLLLLQVFFLMPLTIGKLQLSGIELGKVSAFFIFNFSVKSVLLLLINVLILFVAISTYMGFYILSAIFALVGFVLLAKLNAVILTSIENAVEIEDKI